MKLALMLPTCAIDLWEPCEGFAESGPHGTWVAERLRCVAWMQ